MTFVYSVLWILNALLIILFKTINILKKICKETHIFGMLPKILP